MRGCFTTRGAGVSPNASARYGSLQRTRRTDVGTGVPPLQRLHSMPSFSSVTGLSTIPSLSTKAPCRASSSGRSRPSMIPARRHAAMQRATYGLRGPQFPEDPEGAPFTCRIPRVATDIRCRRAPLTQVDKIAFRTRFSVASTPRTLRLTNNDIDVLGQNCSRCEACALVPHTREETGVKWQALVHMQIEASEEGSYTGPRF